MIVLCMLPGAETAGHCFNTHSLGGSHFVIDQKNDAPLRRQITLTDLST